MANVVPVGKILQAYNEGKRKQYDILLGDLGKSTIEDALLVGYLKGMKKCISALGQKHEYIVGVIVNINWAGRSKDVVKEFHIVMLNLVTAHPIYLKAVLRSLVKTFQQTRSLSDDTSVVSDEAYFANIHSLLRDILKLVPLSTKILIQLLQPPFAGAETDKHKGFLQNALHICSYIGKEHYSTIINMIVHHITAIDVRIPRHTIQTFMEDSDSEDEMDDSQFPMDAFELNAQIGSHIDERKNIEKSIDKLDIVMEVMFQYMESACHPNGKFNFESSKRLYTQLLGSFDNVILRTLNTGHVQFLIFYVCNLDKRFKIGFTDYLLHRVKDVNIDALYRQAAACYLASFLGRAQFINIEDTMLSLDVLAEWIHKYIDNACDSAIVHTSVAHHGPFYAACQALFYVFTFSHKEILLQPEARINRWRLPFIVNSRLNPLKSCYAPIVQNFSAVTLRYNVVLCNPVLESNRRAAIGLDGTAVDNPLYSYFGFDPYLLERSGERVAHLVRQYVLQEEKPVNNDIEEDAHYKSDDDLDNHLCTSDLDIDKLACSMELALSPELF